MQEVPFVLDSIVEAWAGLSEDTRLFLRIACLFDSQRVPKGPLLTLLRVEGWDEDLFDVASEEARREELIALDGAKLRVPLPVAAFVRRQTSPSLPESVAHAHFDGLWSAARAVNDRPADAAAIEAFLDYPLEREDWDGVGGEADVALAAMASTVGLAITRVDRARRREQALSWFLRALPQVEAAADMDVTTRDGVELLTSLWHLVAQIASLYDEFADGDEERVLAAVQYHQKAAETAARLIDASASWRETSGVHWATLAQRLERLGRQEEAQGHHERAARLLAEYWDTAIPEESKLDSRMILVESLVALGREDEAFGWFDRAASDTRLGKDDWARTAKLAKTAFRIGEELFHAEDSPDAEGKIRSCIEWLERASVLGDGIEVRTTELDWALGQSLLMVSVLRTKPILDLPGPMPAAVERRAGMGEEELAVALSWLDRFLSFTEGGTALPEAMNVARAQALEVGATLHHHAGRPAEALAMLERADALREHVDEALSWISDGREVERWLIRGRCLRAVGQVEAAARAFVHGLEHASHRLRKQSREWMDWEHDDAALEIAQIHAEIGAIRDEAGVAEILARVPLSPRKTRATARMYAAYLAAIADDPDAAAFAFEQGQAEEGEAAHDRAFFRVAVAVTRSIALSYARAERVEEAIGWTHRIYQAYGFPASRMAERHRAKILARRAEGAQFEAVIDAAVHDALQRMERFVVGLFSGSLRDESEKGEDAGEDDDTDEEDDETDEDDEDP